MSLYLDSFSSDLVLLGNVFGVALSGALVVQGLSCKVFSKHRITS